MHWSSLQGSGIFTHKDGTNRFSCNVGKEQYNTTQHNTIQNKLRNITGERKFLEVQFEVTGEKTGAAMPIEAL